ncbi:hypothetical protein K439DRAFT_1621943 [Ramaria rubella]|nr:hypothetical protein K439DRAFT_1621943 [Ramaria rubella]
MAHCVELGREIEGFTGGKKRPHAPWADLEATYLASVPKFRKKNPIDMTSYPTLEFGTFWQTCVLGCWSSRQYELLLRHVGIWVSCAAVMVLQSSDDEGNFYSDDKQL